MKIAYVGNFTQPHCTEVHLAATLEKLGHLITRLQEDGYTPDQLQNVVDQSDFDLFLYTRTWGNTVTLEHLAALRERNIPSASYHLDLYVGLKREDGLDNDPFWRTDFVFTPDGDPASQVVFEAKGIQHFYLKPGVYEDECYIKARAPASINGTELGNKVIFVGGGAAAGEPNQYGHKEWGYRGQLIRWLMDTYGEDFSKYGWPAETVRNDPLNQLYANSDVVVGDSLCLQDFTHPYYWSDRVYETIGRGGFLIHPYIKGLEEEFTDGENIVFYEYGNFEQLKQKIDYYLDPANTEERLRIRNAGFELVKSKCTYTDRLKQMLGVVSGTTAVPTPSVVPPTTSTEPLKIHLGAGTEILDGYVNTDIVELPGIDRVFNVMDFPWGFDDESAVEIKAKDLIEHLPSHTRNYDNSLNLFIEECHRILKPGGLLWIQTPSWDSDFLWIDYTHVRGFDVRSFDFFDPDTDFGRGTGFYSKAKFAVKATKTENKNLIFEMIKL